jgi:hypothetical protein
MTVVSTTSLRSIPHWVRAAAALDLPSDLAPPPRPLGPAVWRGFLSAVSQRRLVGPMARWAAQGRWPVTDDQFGQVGDAHRSLCSRDLLLERELLATAGGLRAARVDFLVLKGPSLARAVYPSPADRSFRDIDLLIAPGAMERAVAAMTDRGARRHFPEPRPGFDARFSKGAAFTAPSGYEVDLHRSLALGVYGLLVDPASLFHHTGTFELAGDRFGCPGPAGLAAHAAVHAVLGDPSPRWETLRDVGMTLVHPDTDLAAVVALVGSWRSTEVLAYAIGATWTELELDRAHPAYLWAAGQRLGPTEVTRLHAYLGRERSHARAAIAGLAAIPAWADRARYLRGIALPDAALRSHPQRWRRGARALRRRQAGGAAR